jgi:hypothetical protein
VLLLFAATEFEDDVGQRKTARGYLGPRAVVRSPPYHAELLA